MGVQVQLLSFPPKLRASSKQASGKPKRRLASKASKSKNTSGSMNPW